MDRKELNTEVAKALGAKEAGEFWIFPERTRIARTLKRDFEPAYFTNSFFLVILFEIHALRKTDTPSHIYPDKLYLAQGTPDGEWFKGDIATAVCLAFIDKVEQEKRLIPELWGCGFCAQFKKLSEFPEDSPIHKELERNPSNPNPHTVGICSECQSKRSGGGIIKTLTTAVKKKLNR